ncbi:MAG: response regulator [Chloroflexi bacterium]|nr:MAG: response regulator [Chloroflexota bacterium]
MPEMGGINLYNAIREKYPDVKIILMSGYAQQLNKSQLPLEKLSWLKKPFTIEKLTRTLHNAIKSQS